MMHHPKLFIATAPHYVSEVLDEVLQSDWARNSVACVSINFSNVARVYIAVAVAVAGWVAGLQLACVIYNKSLLQHNDASS